MNKFTENSTLTIDDTVYTVALRRNDTILLSISSDDILIKALPIKRVGDLEYVSINNRTLFADNFESPIFSPIKMRDFTKEEAEKYQEYLSTLYKPIGANINDPFIH